ncbi:hypothetical protein [Flavobacterium sp.]|uniref:hypothetical protein n=1 Tax=Flavobacterium sp. TaxID=239 RepID=UPI00286DC5CA|nr:hypothetical protein [Flavobacterium sp.]
MKKILSIIILLNFISCNNTGVTAKEENAVQQVLNFYNGECLRSKGLKSENGNSKSYFELEMSKSELLNIKAKSLKTHSANIAYLFYSNLDGEKENYQEIKVKVILDNGTNEEFTYSNLELLEIEKLQSFINQIIEKITKKEYEKLLISFDKSIDIEAKSIENLFSTLENQYGKINKEVQFQGFEFRETKNYGNVIVIKQALIFGKTALSMNLIIKRENSKLISIEFQ